MAVNDNATLVIGAGNFYTAPVGTARPADLLAVPVAWDPIGHTSLEDILSIASDGGEATTLGTLQNKTLRTTYSARTETMAIVLQQFDTAGLKLYYGSNATVDATTGDVQVPASPVPTQVAFMAIFTDGTNEFGIYMPKAEIFRNDDVAFGDTESLAGLPLGITPLQHNSNTWTYAVTALGGA